MPQLLKSQVAYLALFVAFLIPVSLSSLRGLSHVLTCAEQVETPFTVVLGEGGPIVLSSAALVAGEDSSLCGGLEVDMQAAIAGDDRAALELIVVNTSEFPWRGTISVELMDAGVVGSTLIPVDVGRIDAGGRANDELVVRLGDGTHELSGRLLVGP